MEVTRVSHGSPRRWALLTVLVGLMLAGCSGSSATTPPGGATSAGTTPAPPTVAAIVGTPVPTPVLTAAAAACPSAATVGTALGITVPAPVGVDAKLHGQLPAGATGIVCDYHASALNVIIEVLSNIDPSSISKFTAQFPTAPVSVAGVGDQAQSFQVSLGGGKDNEGVVATKGSTLVDITATATPATLAQVEALVTQLL